MADLGAAATDKKIKELEDRIEAVYGHAAQAMQKKSNEFVQKFKVKDAMMQGKVKDGKITKEEYAAWRAGQIFQSNEWKAKVSSLTLDMLNAGKTAQKLINGEVNGVFAINANYVAYQIEKDCYADMGFGLYDAHTVAELLKSDKQLLPKKKLDDGKELEWDKKKLTQAVTQGIIRGENLDQIAKRMVSFCGMNEKFAKINAKTAMTAAQNAGRIQTLRDAEKLGIKAKKVWIATLDDRTRPEHRILDGKMVPQNQPFRGMIAGKKFDIRYPGDPTADPHLTYSCRCTLGYELEDSPSKNASRYDNITGQRIKDMSYKEWAKYKQKKGAVPPFVAAKQSDAKIVLSP